MLCPQIGAIVSPESKHSILGRPTSGTIQPVTCTTPLHHNNCVKATITNVHVKIIIYSGASICCSNSLLKRLMPVVTLQQHVLDSDITQIYGVGGEILSTIGKC